MSDRYFVETPITGAHAQLVGSEAHHLAHVMRAGPGQTVTLFDGSGAEFDARVERVGRSSVELVVVGRVGADRELTQHITLAVSLPKGDRQRWLVEKATELGVTCVVPLITARSVAQPVAAALARLRRAVIEASKQCGRNRLMEIADAQPWREFVSGVSKSALRWIAHRGPTEDHSRRPPLHLDKQVAGTKQEIFFAIGPEGGFIDQEVAIAVDAGWQQIDLGPRILRVETAAIAVVSWAALSAEESSP